MIRIHTLLYKKAPIMTIDKKYFHLKKQKKESAYFHLKEYTV